MSRQRFLPAAGIPRLVEALIHAGTRVYGPTRIRLKADSTYGRIAESADLDLDAPLPAIPLKALFLPPSEALFTWRRQHEDVTLTPVALPAQPSVVIGARPCDAAALETLDKVMGWDYRDDTWFARREATTIVTLACQPQAALEPCSTASDEQVWGRASARTDRPCSTGFCEKVGLASDSGKGSDVILRRTEDGDEGFVAEALSEKGEKLLELAEQKLGEAKQKLRPTPVPEAKQKLRPTPVAEAKQELGGTLELVPIQGWLAAHFDDPIWATLGLRCHGCGACASVCPTCHCFDIVDEADGLLSGARRRNWDTCQAAKFTVHASGHNPRGDQHSRFRQRVLHKFSIYPQRFGEVLCTGCGRCVAACPAGQDLPEILAAAERAALGGPEQAS